jgi:hypothetical protein
MTNFDRIGNAFIRGAFEGALVVIVAFLLCGLFGRDLRDWLHSRSTDTTEPPLPTAVVAPPAPPRHAAATPARPAPRRRAKAVPAEDEGVREAARWARCAGPACYYDMR